MTLPEILISCFLLLLFMGACYSLYNRALLTFRMGDQSTTCLARARNAMHFIAGEVRDSQDLCRPFSYQITAATAANPVTSSYIIMRTPSGGVNIRFDEATNTIEKVVYAPGFDPDQPSTWVIKERNTVARGIEYLTFTWVAPENVWQTSPTPWCSPMPQFMQISLKTTTDPGASESATALTTKVLMRE
jgi:hypothetical protein